MKSTLIIVESPKKIDKMQEALGPNYVVLASKGHIADLGKGGFRGIGVDVLSNFKTYYVLIKEKIATVDELINAAEKANNILLCSDPDREGEGIAWHLKSRLESSGKSIKRMEVRELNKKAISSAVLNTREIDLNLFDSQEARRILDRIVGFMVSPFLINYFGNNLSAGRVQSVATRMIVDRDREIESFKPEEFWNLNAELVYDNKKFELKYDGKIKTEKEAEQKKNICLESKDFLVLEVKGKEKLELPPAPMITSKLQQLMAKKFSFDPDRTMRAAQGLYETGYCSYIRTDSTRISDEAIEMARDWLKTNKLDLPKSGRSFSVKDSAQDAHECIRPSDVFMDPDNAGLQGDEKIVYKVIWQYFIASQMTPAIWDTLAIKCVPKTNKKMVFKTSGKALKYKGFLEFFNFEKSEINLPSLQKNQELPLAKDNPIKYEQRFTQPPPRYNDASFLKELETKEIGRPATYAEILKKITARNYVEKSGTTYHSTEIGKKITDILTKFFPFMDYEYTANMEKKLDQIASGTLNKLDMLNEFFDAFKKQLDLAYLSHGGILCEKCKSPMLARINKNDGRKFLGCSNYPKCNNIINQIEKDVSSALYLTSKESTLSA